ncbi:TPA: hypothetical protein DF272_00535 [Candidatus Falkowbacteria bacterium]|nr:hypothetical protein [Candidatus Falkowbacteria bacterium]
MPFQLTSTAKYLGLATICLLFFSFLQFSTNLGDPDAFYHAKIIKLMQQNLIVSDFSSMQFSTLKDIYTDHHFIFHLLHLPLSDIFNPLMTVKVGNIILTTAFFLIFYWFLIKQKIPLRWLLITLLFLCPPFIFRLSLIKANSLSLIFLILFISLFFYALKPRYFLLTCFLAFLLACLYVLSYGGWILILPIFFIFSFVHLWSKQRPTKTLLSLLFSLILGLGLGLLLHPYFPQNLFFFKQQIFDIGFINLQNQINVGTEWYRTSLSDFIASLRFIIIFFLIAFILNVLNWKKTTHPTVFFFLLTLIFTIFTIKSRRYVEYLAPFVVLFIGQSFSQNLPLLLEFWTQIKTYFSRLPYIFAGIVISSLVLVNIIFTTASLWINLNDFPYNFYQSASIFINRELPRQSPIFHTAWDEWSPLFYYTDNHTFISGLDPTFSYLFNPAKHLLWQTLAAGYDTDPIRTIPTDFNAKYIVANKGYDRFIAQLNSDPRVSLIFEDDHSLIYVINQ